MIPYRDSIPCLHRPWATWGLIIVNALIFLLLSTQPEAVERVVFQLYGLIPARYGAYFGYPEWAQWAGYSSADFTPFFTSIFLHGSWWHVIGNMWLLWIFGDNIEDRMGPLRFLCFYLLCGLVAGLLQVIANPFSTIPAVGASGAIAGVMGAYFFLYPFARVVMWVFFLPLFVEIPAIAFLGAWVIFQLYKVTSGLGASEHYADVAWWGHLGGFIAGMLIHRLFMFGNAGMQTETK